MTDLSLRIKKWNNAAERIYGFKEEEVLGKIIHEVIKTDYSIDGSDFFLDHFLREGLWQGEVIQIKKDQTPLRILASISLVKNSDGIPIAALAINQDISFKIKTESYILQKRVKELTLLHKLTRYSTDSEWRLQDVFLECLEIIPPAWQYPEQTHAKILYDGKNYSLSTFQESKHFLSENIEIGGSKRGIIEVHVLNGASSEMIEPFLAEEEELLQSIAKMLGEFGLRFQMELELKTSEEILRSTLESLDDLVLLMDESGNLKTFFPFVSQKLWFSPEEFLGKKYTEVFPEHVVGLFNSSIQSIQKVDIVQQFNYPMVIGDQESWFNARLSSRKTSDGGYQGVTIIIRNITEQKKTENDINLLHSVLNHDLKNKLGVVEGSLSLLKYAELPKKLDKLVNIALNASIEGNNLIRKISHLENIFQTSTEIDDSLPQTQIVEVINDVISEHLNRASELGIKIQFKPIEIDFSIPKDSLLREAISNIVDNSIHHSLCSVVNITIQARNGQVLVIIEDNGVGISDDSKNEIFKKGYKGKESQGAGFGLFLVQTIIQKYQGQISVEDSVTGGAKFIITFKNDK